MKSGREKAQKAGGKAGSGVAVEIPDEQEIVEILSPYVREMPAYLPGMVRSHLGLLTAWNRKVGLTALTDPRDILRMLFGESFFGIIAAGTAGGLAVDDGSGAAGSTGGEFNEKGCFSPGGASQFGLRRPFGGFSGQIRAMEPRARASRLDSQPCCSRGSEIFVSGPIGPPPDRACRAVDDKRSSRKDCQRVCLGVAVEGRGADTRVQKPVRFCWDPCGSMIEAS